MFSKSMRKKREDLRGQAVIAALEIGAAIANVIIAYL